MKIRALAALALTVLALALALLAWEFRWRSLHDLAKPPAPSPDGALVAEVRALGGAREVAPTGVYLRGRGAWLRSLRPHLVFSGECDEVQARWFGPHRLVIECALRSGEPRQLQEVYEGVAIEVIVQRRFAFFRVREPAPCAT